MRTLPSFRNWVYLIIFIVMSTPLSAQFFHDHNKELPCVEKQFNIMSHVTLDSASQAPILSQFQIDSILGLTSRYFSPICMSFTSCEYNIIPTYTFSEIFDDLRLSEASILYGKPRRINVIFVKTEPKNTCGASVFEGLMHQDSATVFIETQCGDGPSEQLAHHIGHLLGLQDTDGPDNPIELVDGSNCDVAGDLLCDTPADPFGLKLDLNTLQLVRLNLEERNPNVYARDCEFTSQLKDENKEFFQPHVGNMMSNYYCKCGFSRDQFLLMVENYNKATFKHY